MQRLHSYCKYQELPAIVFMLQTEASGPRLVGRSVSLLVGLSVFKTRFAINQTCLQKKICFQCLGAIPSEYDLGRNERGL